MIIISLHHRSSSIFSPAIVLFIMFSISEVVDHACMVDSNAYMQSNNNNNNNNNILEHVL